MEALQQQMAQLQLMGGRPAYPMQYAVPQAQGARPADSANNLLSMPPPLRVCVEGIPFTYQLTEEDLNTVFRRFGDVVHVAVHPSGNVGAVQFYEWPPAMQALSLHQKELQGLTGSHLLVEVMTPDDVRAFYQQAGVSPPSVSPMVAALSQSGGAPRLAHAHTQPLAAHVSVAPVDGMGSMNGARHAPAVGFDDSASPGGSGARKFTCRFEVGPRHDGNKGISNYKVASKMIHFVAVPIWKAIPAVKTRVRGRGSGFKEGPRKVEANEPLQLCISSPSYPEYARALAMAESGLVQIQNEYWGTTSTLLPVQKFEQPIFERPEKPQKPKARSSKSRGSGKKEAALERAQTSPAPAVEGE